MIDPIRHLEVFSPHAFGNRRVDVIGAGATGSRITMLLAKLGITNIHVWDDDRIEAHNVVNQIFGNGDIGKLKVDALAELVRATTGTELQVHPQRVTGPETLGEVVFLLTDTMESRRQIWESAIKYKLAIKLLIETRMGTDVGRIYTFCPNRPAECRGWEETLYTDAKTETSLCGTPVSVGPTADVLAGLAVWQLIKWFSIEEGKQADLDHEIVFSILPPLLISQKFAAAA